AHGRNAHGARRSCVLPPRGLRATGSGTRAAPPPGWRGCANRSPGGRRYPEHGGGPASRSERDRNVRRDRLPDGYSRSGHGRQRPAGSPAPAPRAREQRLQADREPDPGNDESNKQTDLEERGRCENARQLIAEQRHDREPRRQSESGADDIIRERDAEGSRDEIDEGERRDRHEAHRRDREFPAARDDTPDTVQARTEEGRQGSWGQP